MPLRYNLSPEDDLWQFHDQSAADPASLFKNAAGRSAYEQQAAGNPRANEVRDNISARLAQQRAAADANANAEAERQTRLGQESLQQQGANYRTSTQIAGELTSQTQRLAAGAAQADSNRALDAWVAEDRSRQATLDWGLRGAEALDTSNLKHEALGEQRYQFDQEQGRRGYEFEQGRLPSQRDVFEHANRMGLQKDSQDFQMKEQEARYQLMGELHATELANGERQSLVRMQNAVADVNRAVQTGDLTAQEGQAMVMRLKTGIDPLKERLTRSQMMRQNALAEQETQTAARQASIAEMNLKFMGQSFADRVGSWQDPETGHTFHFYQEAPGKFTFMPDKQAQVEERAFERERMAHETAKTRYNADLARHETRAAAVTGTRDRLAKEWDDQDQRNRQRLEKRLEKWQESADLDPAAAKNFANESRDFEQNHERDMQRHFEQKTRTKAQPGVPIQDQFNAWLDQTHPLPTPPTMQAPQGNWNSPAAPQGKPPLTPLQQQQESQRVPGGAHFPSGRDVSGPSSAPEQPASAPTGQLDQMIAEARNGNTSVHGSLLRIKSALTKYKSIAEMPPVEQQRFLRDMKNAGLENQ